MGSLETSISILEYVGILMDSIDYTSFFPAWVLNQLINRALETDRWLSKGQLYNWWKLGEWDFDVSKWACPISSSSELETFPPSNWHNWETSGNLHSVRPHIMWQKRGEQTKIEDKKLLNQAFLAPFSPNLQII